LLLRQRIGIELKHCLATTDVQSNCNLISEYEINQAALTISHAMVNPCE
jgi:hypothetical protein